MFEARLVQGKLFKQLIESIRDLVQDAPIDCSDEDGLESKLKKVAKESELKKVVLAIDNPAGPDGYKVSKDAEVTVVLYKNRNAKANFTFAKGSKISDKDIDAIIEATSKITK